MKTFTEAWKEYTNKVYNDWNALPEEQRKQLFMAFHAGAVVVLGMMCEIASNDDLPRKEKERLMTSLKKEVLSRTEEFTDQNEKRN